MYPDHWFHNIAILMALYLDTILIPAWRAGLFGASTFLSEEKKILSRSNAGDLIEPLFSLRPNQSPRLMAE
jgi:hypothetical protein